MIRHEYIADHWPVFIRDSARGPGGVQRAHGHGLVVARRVMGLNGMTLSYDVRMANGVIRSCTIDHFWNPENIARRMITPSPVGIPAPPAYGARTCL